MTILGKLLIVFNLLAAGAFTYVTLQDWRTRQDLTRAGFSREVVLRGLPVEARAATAEETEAGRVPFQFTMPGDLQYTTVEKSLLKYIVPAGDVASQTEELKRVQKKVLENIADEKLTPVERLQWEKAYLASVAKTGAERDGVNALFDMLDPVRLPAARRDLPLLGRTSSQWGALRAMVDVSDLGDPQGIMPETARTTRVAQAREAVKRFLLGEVPHGVPPSKDPQNEAERTLRNRVIDAMNKPGEAEKAAVVAAATGEKAAELWAHLANVAVEPLADKPSVDRAMAALLAYAQGKAAVDSEKAALAGIKDLISPPPVNFDMAKTVEQVGKDLLNAKFDEAAIPAATGKTGPSVGEKARRIAHLLYHIDGWRHAVKDDATVADRKAWHQRVVSVVGLPEYIRMAESQATEYSEAAQRLLSAITEEQSAFEAEYQALVQQVQGLYAQWLTLDAQLKAQDAVTKENERLVQERTTERDNLRKALEQATEDAKTALDRLKATQTRLFNIQRDLRDAHAAILEMEKELRRIELGPEAEKK